MQKDIQNSRQQTNRVVLYGPTPGFPKRTFVSSEFLAAGTFNFRAHRAPLPETKEVKG